MIEVLDWLERGPKDKTLFSDESGSITYGGYQLCAKKTASALAEKVRTTRQPIVVFIDRSIRSLCAIGGVVYSGNFYVPIDADQPKERIAAMLTQVQPRAAISVSDHLDSEGGFSSFCQIFSYDNLAGHDINDSLLQQIRRAALDVDPIYAICTSGSTGVPKVVLISHRSVVDFVPKFAGRFGFTRDEVFGNQAPFDFDVSTKDIYSTVFCGAAMHIIPKKAFVMPKLLMGCLNERKITTIIWAVSAMCILSGFNSFKNGIPQYLKNVLFSGEQMPMKHLNIWRKYMPDLQYVNLYGPTEITCNCTYYIVDREFEDTDVLPIGIPFENEGVMVINEDGSPIKPGETGEICVRGSCLALGYYRDPERTALAFRQTPEHNNYQELIYHTGDLACLNDRNEYVFTSRKDFQIKHMGHRIELGEIETCAGAVDGIRYACCLYDQQKNKIVLFYDGETEKSLLIERLKQLLPKYMMPNVYIRPETMPLNKNGKIDRQRLKTMYSTTID